MINYRDLVLVGQDPFGQAAIISNLDARKKEGADLGGDPEIRQMGARAQAAFPEYMKPS
jgi:hypothetical protein